MVEKSSIRSLIDCWPSRRELARDCAVAESRVHNWAKQGTIPARFWGRILRSAAARSISVDAALLVRLHDEDAPPAPELEAAR